MDSVNEIYVYENWKSDTPSLIGTLYADGGIKYDDHLRNHGFVLAKTGWSLSPLYDVNPSIYGDTLSLNVDSDNNLIDFNLALSVAKMYGLTDVQALEELKEIKNVAESNWRRLAGQYGLSRSEIEGMAPAFDMSFKG